MGHQQVWGLFQANLVRPAGITVLMRVYVARYKDKVREKNHSIRDLFPFFLGSCKDNTSRGSFLPGAVMNPYVSRRQRTHLSLVAENMERNSEGIGIH